MNFWETVENRKVDCCRPPAFADWRALVDRFFAQPPAV